MERNNVDEGSDKRAETDRSFEEADAQGLEMFIVPRDDMLDVVFMEPLTDEQRAVLEPALGQAIWDAISRVQIREQRQNAARNPRPNAQHPRKAEALKLARAIADLNPTLKRSQIAARVAAGMDGDDIPNYGTIARWMSETRR